MTHNLPLKSPIARSNTVLQVGLSESAGERLTSYQVMALLRKRYYLAFSVGTEQIASVEMDEPAGVLRVATVRARLRDSRTEQIVTHHGARFIVYSLTYNRTVTDETVWIKLPQPVRLSIWGVKNTPERIHLDWLRDRMCGRPGSSSWTGGASARMGQRDSYQYRLDTGTLDHYSMVQESREILEDR